MGKTKLKGDILFYNGRQTRIKAGDVLCVDMENHTVSFTRGMESLSFKLTGDNKIIFDLSLLDVPVLSRLMSIATGLYCEVERKEKYPNKCWIVFRK